MGRETPINHTVLPARNAWIQLALRILALVAAIVALSTAIYANVTWGCGYNFLFFTVSWLILVNILDIIGLSAYFKHKYLRRSTAGNLFAIDLLAVILLTGAMIRQVVWAGAYGWIVFDEWDEDLQTRPEKQIETVALAAGIAAGSIHLLFIFIDLVELIAARRQEKMKKMEAEASAAAPATVMV